MLQLLRRARTRREALSEAESEKVLKVKQTWSLGSSLSHRQGEHRHRRPQTDSEQANSDGIYGRIG